MDTVACCGTGRDVARGVDGGGDHAYRDDVVGVVWLMHFLSV